MKTMPRKSQNKSDGIGYRRPPKKYQFKKGQSGNPSGVGKKRSKTPSIKAQLEDELSKTVKVRGGKRPKQLSKAAAGIKHLVDQFAEGDRNARRDLIALCEKLRLPLMNRDELEGALAEALSAEDEALLADFVERHGGEYPPCGDTVGNHDQNINHLDHPKHDRKLLAAARGQQSDKSTRGRHE